MTTAITDSSRKGNLTWGIGGCLGEVWGKDGAMRRKVGESGGELKGQKGENVGG